MGALALLDLGLAMSALFLQGLFWCVQPGVCGSKGGLAQAVFGASCPQGHEEAVGHQQWAKPSRETAGIPPNCVKGRKRDEYILGW